jgi:hypothetical protein
MAYRVKLPPQDEDIGDIYRVSYPPENGDSGDAGDRTDKTSHLDALGVPAPPVCPPLPKAVRLVRYAPKTPPVAIRPISLVTDVEKFIRHYLQELDARLNNPVQIRAGGSVFEILSKLAEAGVELAIEGPQRGDPQQDQAT